MSDSNAPNDALHIAPASDSNPLHSIPATIAEPTIAEPSAAPAIASLPEPAGRVYSFAIATAGAALWFASCLAMASLAGSYALWSIDPASDNGWSLMVALLSAPEPCAWALAASGICALALAMFSKPQTGSPRQAKAAKLLHMALCSALALSLEASGFFSLAAQHGPGHRPAWAASLLGAALAALCARGLWRGRSKARGEQRDLGHYPGATWAAGIAMGWFAASCAFGMHSTVHERQSDAASSLSLSNSSAIKSANKVEDLRAESESELASEWRARTAPPR